jgi:hypothetical protein
MRNDVGGAGDRDVAQLTPPNRHPAQTNGSLDRAAFRKLNEESVWIDDPSVVVKRHVFERDDDGWTNDLCVLVGSPLDQTVLVCLVWKADYSVISSDGHGDLPLK